MTLEFWTMLRYLQYPIILVFGLMWMFVCLRAYRIYRYHRDLWSGLLGGAVGMFGLAGLSSLSVARVIGFGAQSSALITMGVTELLITLLSAIVAHWIHAWQHTK